MVRRGFMDNMVYFETTVFGFIGIVKPMRRGIVNKIEQTYLFIFTTVYFLIPYY